MRSTNCHPVLGGCQRCVAVLLAAAWSPPPVLVRGPHLLDPAGVESVGPPTVERDADLAIAGRAFDFPFLPFSPCSTCDFTWRTLS